MRKTYAAFFAVFSSLLVELIIPGMAQAEIVGTQHDLGGGICDNCHTPAIAKPPDPPLWNRQNSVNANFTMYDSPTLTPSTGGQPHGISLVCLGCHDGVISRNTLLKGSESARGQNHNESQWAPGRHGPSNRHPISISYDQRLGVDFKAATAREVGGLPLYPLQVAEAIFNNVECASCHNPHDTTYGHYLRMDNSQSALCLTCHNK